MKKIVQEAIDSGADDARWISVDAICIEDSVLDMCKKPHCNGFGKTIHCPPHSMKPWEFREFIRQYSHAVIFKLNVPAGDMMSDKRDGIFRKIYDIAARVESSAKSAGFERSRGFAAGSCKPVFCKEHKVCQALTDKTCRNPSLARPSMEAVGINVMKVIQEVGWKIQPIDATTDPESFPDVVMSGLVLVG